MRKMRVRVAIFWAAVLSVCLGQFLSGCSCSGEWRSDDPSVPSFRVQVFDAHLGKGGRLESAYPEFAELVLYADAAPSGRHFSCFWVNGMQTEQNPLRVKITRDTIVLAVFSPDPGEPPPPLTGDFQVNVINVFPAGMKDPAFETVVTVGSYPAGAEVLLEPKTYPGVVFDHWERGGEFFYSDTLVVPADGSSTTAVYVRSNSSGALSTAAVSVRSNAAGAALNAWKFWRRS